MDNTPDWDNDISPGEDGKLEYILWDTRIEEGWNHPLIRRTLEAGRAAADAGSEKAGHHLVPGPVTANRSSSAAAPSASGESRAAEGSAVNDSLDGSPGVRSGISAFPSAAPFSLDDWCAEGMQLVYFGIALRDGQDEVRFRIGDWFNKGEQTLSDEVYGYLRGFEDVTVRQYSWVAGRVAPDTRVSELSWTYHRAVAALEPPEQEKRLRQAQEENLSSKGLYQAIHGKRPTVKRWTIEELGVKAHEFWDSAEDDRLFEFVHWLAAK